MARFALILGLAGCSRLAPPEPATSPAPVERPEPVVKSHAAGVAAAQVFGPSEVAASRLVLDGAGLRLINTVSGASRLIPFGTSKSDAMRAIGAAQKTPVISEAGERDCHASHVSWDTGLTLWFARERMVGWSAAAGAAPLATGAGIKVGSSRQELADAYAATFNRSTRGQEFSAAAIGGLLDSDRSGAVITQLWAGQVCIAGKGREPAEG